MKLNEVAKKIQPLNFGVSNKSFQSTIAYSLSRKGRMGLKGLPVDEKFHDVSHEEVVVKDINPIFHEIILSSQGRDIIVKMDCEGEELNLVRSLHDSGLLKKISVLIVEYHYIPPDDFEKLLGAFDFHVFSSTFSSLDSGMIYASR